MHPFSTSPLPGRDRPVLADPAPHAVLGTSLTGPWPDTEVIHLALGCFWGAEKALWETPGVVATAAGYQGGTTANPTYREVCSGRTGHAETVRVAYDPAVLTTEKLLRLFFELHDPTQGDRQGNDVGTQYRSAVYATTPDQLATARAVRDRYAVALAAAGYGPVTTEIAPVAGTPAAAPSVMGDVERRGTRASDAGGAERHGAAAPNPTAGGATAEVGATTAEVGGAVGPFYLAEDDHQQYLHKVPHGYCPVHSTGVACPAPA